MPTYEINQEQAGQRLDKFLVAELPDLTRSQIQKIIKDGGILVNGKPVPVHHFLKEHETVTILRAHPAVGARPSKNPTTPINTVRNTPSLEIIADTPDYLIVNKPAGLLVHQAPGHEGEPTLVDLVLKKYPAIAKIGEDPERPGIVHRLDREVSGIIVVAKTQDMFDLLKSQFKSHQVKKIYTALVYGSPSKVEDEISFNIDRSTRHGYRMAAVPKSPDEKRGRKAITEFEVTKRLGNYTLLEVKPQSGRTHQIRVHLAAYGLPIVGDETYKPKKLRPTIRMHRLFLHAHYLGFSDQNGQWREFFLPLPSELQVVLDRLNAKMG